MKIPDSPVYEFSDFRLDTGKRLLTKGESEKVALTSKVFDTLLYLLEHRGKVVEKDELLSGVWPDAIVEENNLSQNISILRRVLGETRSEHRFIVTIPGKGYKFVAPVRIAIPGDQLAVRDEERDPTASETPYRYDVGREDQVPAIGDWTDKDHDRSEDNRRPPVPAKRRWTILAATAVGIFILGSLGFYLRGVSSRPSAAPVETIAVLPFKPLVAGHRDEALELGMADALITQLNENREIKVRPLSSVRKFVELEQDAVQAGRQLEADLVLDGSIQRSDDKLRVSVWLVNVADERVLWTKKFDKTFTDILDVQEAIAEEVGSALVTRLGGPTNPDKQRRDTSNAEAYEFYTLARFHWSVATPPSLNTSIRYFEKAIEADPNYARAHAGLAEVYRMQAYNGFARAREVCPKSKALAMRALELDESIADAHTVLGWIAFLYEWDWETAEIQIKRAIELEPNNSDARRAYAVFLSAVGRGDDAVREAGLARELAPLTPFVGAVEAAVLSYTGHLDQALYRLDKVLELDPNSWHAHYEKGMVHHKQGRFDEAIREWKTAREIAPASPFPNASLIMADARSGHRDKALEGLQQLRSIAATRFVSNLTFAGIYDALDDHEKTLDHLEAAYHEREARLIWIRGDLFANLRSEPRFIALVDNINFPE